MLEGIKIELRGVTGSLGEEAVIQRFRPSAIRMAQWSEIDLLGRHPRGHEGEAFSLWHC